MRKRELGKSERESLFLSVTTAVVGCGMWLTYVQTYEVIKMQILRAQQTLLHTSENSAGPDIALTHAPSYPHT